MNPLSNKTIPPGIVLITGAGRRIGRAIALDFAARGWAVGVHYHRSKAEAEAVVAEIAAAGGRAAPLRAELADPSAVAGLVPACVAALGAPTCLINSASLFLEDSLRTVSADLWDQHHALNVRAPVLLARAFAEHLPAGATGGLVVNILDQRVWRPSPEFLSYSVSKAALWQATRMLAQALAPRIRVVAIGPGPVLQSIHQTAEEFVAEQAATPLGHGTTPDEIAAAIQFLLRSPAITGQMLALDGGQHLAWTRADAPGPSQPKSAPEPARWDAPLPASADPSRATAGIRRVIVRELEINTIIGVHDYEKRAPQRIHVWADLAVREAGPSTSDRLDDVLDYAEIVRRIEAVAASGHVNLLETLAEKVAATCLEDAAVLAVRIRIEKPDVITNARAVGIEIERRR